MAKDWAKSFYQSKSWKLIRDYVFYQIDFGLCRRCGEPGELVHHKIYLTPQNINNPAISLNINNLETLCRTCHALEHEGEPATDKGLMFDNQGNLIERSTYEDTNLYS